MKEKKKEIFKVALSFKVAAWMNVGFSVLFVSLSVYQQDIKPVLIGFPHLMYAAFFGLLHLADKEVTFYKKKYLSWRSLAELAAERYDCYKRLYGELPPGKTKEEKKEEQT